MLLQEETYSPFPLSSTTGVSSTLRFSSTWWARGGLGGALGERTIFSPVSFFACFSCGFCLCTNSLRVPLSDFLVVLILERRRGLASSFEYLWCMAFRIPLFRVKGVPDCFPTSLDCFPSSSDFSSVDFSTLLSEMISYGDTDTLWSLDGVLVRGGVRPPFISSFNFLGTLRTFLGGDVTSFFSNSIGFSIWRRTLMSMFPIEWDRRACGAADISKTSSGKR